MTLENDIEDMEELEDLEEDEQLGTDSEEEDSELSDSEVRRTGTRCSARRGHYPYKVVFIHYKAVIIH